MSGRSRRNRSAAGKSRKKAKRTRPIAICLVIGAALVAVAFYLASANQSGASRGQKSDDSCPTSQVEAILGVRLYRGKGDASGGRLGALVQEVSPGSTAAAAGLKGGDVVVSCSGAEVTCPKSLLEALSVLKPSTKAVLVADRGGKEVEASFVWRPD